MLLLKRSLVICGCAIALVSGLPASADLSPAKDGAGMCRDGNAGVFPGLDRIYVRGEFRIIYAMDGHHALVSAGDVNANRIPDQVEDIATQLTVARRIYSEVIGLEHPLNKPRYARAKSIDVFLLNMKRGNGSAYDEAMNYRLGFDGRNGQCILRIDLGNGLARQNVTPAHELFHLYQYGYSMFKARWFLEGTARWAEYAFRPGAGPQSPLPAAGETVQIFSGTYRTSGIWNRLAASTDRVGRPPLPEDLSDAVYTDGSPVIHDERLHGPAFIRAVFEELEKLSASVSSRQRWSRYNWQEAEQRSPAHDDEMFDAVIRALERSFPPGSSPNSDIEALIGTHSRSFVPTGDSRKRP